MNSTARELRSSIWKNETNIIKKHHERLKKCKELEKKSKCWADVYTDSAKVSNGYKNEVFLIVYFSLHFEAFESFQRLVLSSFDDEINILGSVHHRSKIGNHLSMDFASFCPRRTVFVGGLWGGPDRVSLFVGLWVSGFKTFSYLWIQTSEFYETLLVLFIGQ